MMKLFGKPQNIWGWVRIAALVIAIVSIIWTGISLFTPILRTLPWMAWSGTTEFTPILQIEIALTALVLAAAFSVIERETEKMNAYRAQQREARRAAEALLKERKERAFEAIKSVAADRKADSPVDGARVVEIVRDLLPELDGRSKGELLRFLFEQQLLSGEQPPVELTGLNFSHAIVYDAHFEGICLDSANLENVVLDEARLAGSRLAGVNMSISFLRNADLRGAVLARSNLRGTQFYGSNLEGADLQGARLNDANLMKVNLKDCILNDTPARPTPAGSNAIPVMLDQAILVDTILPDGRKVTNEKGHAYLRKKEMNDSLGIR